MLRRYLKVGSLPFKTELGIAILGNVITSRSSDVFLRKFLKILLPLSGQIYVFSYWPKHHNNRVKVISPNRFIINFFGKENRSLFLRFIRAFLVQLVICFDVLKNSKHFHVMIIFNTTAVLPILLAKLIGKKVVPFIAGNPLMCICPDKSLSKVCISKILKLILSIVYYLSDKIVVESSGLIRWLDLYPYLNKIIIRPTFVDTSIFKPSTKIPERHMVGYIGMLSKSKGVIQFVEAIPSIILKRPKLNFIICGYGPCYQDVKKIIEDKRLREKVKLTGWVNNSRIPNYLNKLKLLVLPSRSEGLPNIILEAMACGTPVLAAPVGAIPDVIKEGETGFLLKSINPEHIANRIVKLITNIKLLEEVSTKAHNYVRENFSYERAMETWREIFSELCE